MRKTVKPPALRPGDRITVVSPASPADSARLERGVAELSRLGHTVMLGSNSIAPDRYFAGSEEQRLEELQAAFADPGSRGVFCARGGYGATGLLERLMTAPLTSPKTLLGYSDVTCLQIFLWQGYGLVTFYGPMVAAGFDGGAGKPGGYDADSFNRALSQTQGGWPADLQGETINKGEAEGILLGGCLSLVQTTLATPWAIQTDDAILLLEDCAMKPYQVDRALMHLKQAGKLAGVRGVVLGEFPDSAPSDGSHVTVRDVCERILGDRSVPIVWRAPIGHTRRPMLTLPLGVRARLRASGTGQLEILEPAVCP